MKAYQCPYQINMGCVYMDTAGMFKMKECYDCEYYENGVRPTGATPLFGYIIDRIRKRFKRKKTEEEKKIESWDNFMMGL